MIRVQTTSQAKCIISGEHSCVYGKAALVGTMDLFMTVNGLYEYKEEKKEIKLVIMNADYRNTKITMGVAEFKQFMEVFVSKNLSLNELDGLLSSAFKDRDVMGTCMAFSLVFRKICQISKIDLGEFADLVGQYNCLLDITSAIPIGKGLGSSAAFIVSVMLNYYVRK